MEIINLIETLESRINSYWNIYIVVIFANAGWLFSIDGELSKEVAGLLIGGLILFFISNLSFHYCALNALTVARKELGKIKDESETNNLIAFYCVENIPYRVSGTYALHLSVDAVLITLIVLK